MSIKKDNITAKIKRLIYSNDLDEIIEIIDTLGHTYYYDTLLYSAYSQKIDIFKYIFNILTKELKVKYINMVLVEATWSNRFSMIKYILNNYTEIINYKSLESIIYHAKFYDRYDIIEYADFYKVVIINNIRIAKYKNILLFL